MNNLPKDVTVEIALNLKPRDLIKFCSTNRKMSNICNSKDFWRRKLVTDYPEEMKEIGNTILENPKKVYMERFIYVSKKIEEFIDQMEIILFDDFRQYLNDQYRQEVFNTLYELYENLSERMTAKLDRHPDEDVYNLSIDVFFDYATPFLPPDVSYQRERNLNPLIVDLIADFYNSRIKDLIKN